MTIGELSDEQQQFIQYALSGQNILVDACIGSGKTTAIQLLCEAFGGRKRILYMTYNKLLKEDARAKIRVPRVQVTNYHGFAYGELRRIGVFCGMGDLIQTYLKHLPQTSPYDVLILDEYQDIEQESSELLWHIKDCNPGIQIIVVGDMAQKIYDKTRLDVQSFLYEFLDTYVPLEFTRCFRIGADHAAMLSRIWGKKIVGVNPNCFVEYLSMDDALSFAVTLQPGELLALGRNAGDRSHFQNELEELAPEKFNVHTVWAKISDHDGSSVSPKASDAIFTTYDGCKGMERDVCFVFDWTVGYWETRLVKPNVRYEILRNIFCVAASRGKRRIIFVESEKWPYLEEYDLMNCGRVVPEYEDMSMNEMFQHKFIEDVEAAYGCLDVTKVAEAETVIPVNLTYGLVDLSPCVAAYVKACYFQEWDMNQAICAVSELPGRSHLVRHVSTWSDWNLHAKIQYYAMLETMQQRYYTQVPYPLMDGFCETLIQNRIHQYLPREAKVQIPRRFPFFQEKLLLFHARCMVDAVYQNQPWMLKFVKELTHVHCLELAMQMVSCGFSTGKVFNVATGEVLQVTISDVQAFLDKVTYCVTKGQVQSYACDELTFCKAFVSDHPEVCRALVSQYRGKSFRGVKFVVDFFAKYGLQIPVRPALLRDLLLGKPAKLKEKPKSVKLSGSRRKISVLKEAVE